MANNGHRRRLSELLQEQQEPSLVHRGGAPQCRSVAEVCRRRLRGLCVCDRGGSERGRRGVGVRNGGDTTVLCGGKAPRRALRGWDLAGCFSCGARDKFRRLSRAGGDCDVATEFGDGERQLSPVSVLQLQFDEFDHGDADDSKPSTSGASPSSCPDPHGADSQCPTLYVSVKSQTKRSESLEKTEQAIVSAWESIAADISRIPRLVELDLSASARECRRRIGEEKVRRVGDSIEAMIFEELRWEAVRDMLCLRTSLVVAKPDGDRVTLFMDSLQLSVSDVRCS